MSNITRALQFLDTTALGSPAVPEVHDRPERRRGTRVNVSETGELTVVELGVQVGLLLNLSAGGAAIQAVYATKPRDRLPVQFRLPFTEDTIEATCEVAWVDEARQSGLQFIGFKDDAKQRLRAWLAGHNQASNPVADSDRAPFCVDTGGRAEEEGKPFATVLTSDHSPAVPAISALTEDGVAPGDKLARAGTKTTFRTKFCQTHSLVDLIMRSIHEALQQKEMELQQVLNEAVHEKELQLRELQKVLLKADQILNQLLESEGQMSMGGQSSSYSN